MWTGSDGDVAELTQLLGQVVKSNLIISSNIKNDKGNSYLKSFIACSNLLSLILDIRVDNHITRDLSSPHDFNPGNESQW